MLCCASMIPKTIHQVWLGPDDPPIEWMQTWVNFAMSSDFEYRVWTEHTIRGLENQAAYDYYMHHEQWHGASDVARAEILERMGGWYIDADVELVDPHGFYWDPMQQARFVAVSHPEPDTARVPNTVFAAEPGHRILGRTIALIERQFEHDDLDPVWATVGSCHSRAIALAPKRMRPYFVEAKMFLPFHFGRRVEGEGPTYAIHHQMMTRRHPSWTDLPEYEL